MQLLSSYWVSSFSHQLSWKIEVGCIGRGKKMSHIEKENGLRFISMEQHMNNLSIPIPLWWQTLESSSGLYICSHFSFITINTEPMANKLQLSISFCSVLMFVHLKNHDCFGNAGKSGNILKQWRNSSNSFYQGNKMTRMKDWIEYLPSE